MKPKQEHQKELMDTFKATMEEHILSLNAYLLDLEKKPPAEQREELYRRMLGEYHSIKGSAGTVGQTDVVDLTHELEDLLQMMRQGRLNETVGLFNLHYDSLDAISLTIRCRLNGEESPGDIFRDLRQRIGQVKSRIMSEIKTVDSSVRQPEEQKGKRYILRKGKRHG